MNNVEKKKHNVIYFDWNIMSYIGGLSQLYDELKDKVDCLIHIFNKNINHDNTVFPISTAHFLDIKQGSNRLINEKINLLKKISDNYFIFEMTYDKENIGIQKIDSIADQYTSYIENYKESKKSGEEFKPILEKIIEPTISNAITQINKMDDTKLKHLFENLMESITDIENDRGKIEVMKFNKILRNNNVILGKDFIYPNAKNIDQYKNETIKEEFDEYIKKSDLQYNTTDDFFRTIPDVQIQILSKFQNNVIKLSSLSEITGLTSEKTNKNTAFQSVVNDIQHMVYGLRSHIMVTEDKNLYIKSKLVKKWLDLPVKIMKIDELNKYIIKMLIINSNDNKLKNTKYVFRDENNEIVREYLIDINEE